MREPTGLAGSSIIQNGLRFEFLLTKGTFVRILSQSHKFVILCIWIETAIDDINHLNLVNSLTLIYSLKVDMI